MSNNAGIVRKLLPASAAKKLKVISLDLVLSTLFDSKPLIKTYYWRKYGDN